MLAQINKGILRIRQWINAEEWMIRLLRLSRSEQDQSRPGLIMIQIDGLSYEHFLRATERMRLPFLKGLMGKERYRLWHHYSGIPSSTPAVQGELFYGVKQCIPAFKFCEHESGKILTFYDSSAASQVERCLSNKNDGLLNNGSSYSNIFSGGAQESHYCIASLGWNSILKLLNPYNTLVIILLNLSTLLRLLYYVVIEVFLGVIDFIRGIASGENFIEELRFILSRLIVTIGLREFTTKGCQIDIARGLPVIHINLFGYDEQAHRRGPASRFAYWALPGIDGCIRRIWRSASNSLRRDYEIWIYSDHGQELTVPYFKENRIKLEKSVDHLFRKELPNEKFETHFLAEKVPEGVGCRREKFGFVPKAETISAERQTPRLCVTAQGPLGFIYPHRDLNQEEIHRFAAKLVNDCNIPLVLTRDHTGVLAWMREGCFRLPEDGEKVLGKEHPYLEETVKDLLALVDHPDCGAFVISGWRNDGYPVSFPQENGSHGGPGSNETSGFLLLPPDILLKTGDKKYARPLDLHCAAMDFLRHPQDFIYSPQHAASDKKSIRIMTYNVHRCVGMDGRLSPERIARVIARHQPDVIALQELDVNRMRTGTVDQAEILSRLLDMKFHFHPVIHIEDEMYGNAVLSRFPLDLVRAEMLPRIWKGPSWWEQRGALWVAFEFEKIKFQLINTHLSLWGPERKLQTDALCREDWLGHRDCGLHTILCGDFNAAPHSYTCRTLGRNLEDAQMKLERHKPQKTWFGHLPLGRIDHVFVSPDVEIRNIIVPASRLERMASDHLPLIVDVNLLKIPGEMEKKGGKRHLSSRHAV